MRSVVALFGMILAACSRSGQPSTPPVASAGAVRCTLISLHGPGGPEAESASFLVENGTAFPVTYRAYAKGQPLYEIEDLEGGVWTPTPPLVLCGTRIERFTLAPGETVTLNVGLPADGKQHRYKFGEPLVVTPPVSIAE